ncbi:hypothetical protein SAMN05421788_1011167 [Filimonas lacunae]|uniref:Por secretion system C-terminal sorting domain-containing protein n=1 Tax=Filimonas lacunae TaxID=477680 RepID=A0A173MPZ9_9BACT|nr:hypothetical protein [Filimonas lacunae]BAV09732.1 hypothetical protein FLA_5785 [Filimonas lacunae]SIS78089.1 hypothetical protein SAMN05421788_1011167 [Filimonas lacunae]
MHPGNIQLTLLNDGLDLLEVAVSKPGDLILKVLDVQGRIAKTIIEKVELGAQQLYLNMTDLNTGNYVLNAFIGGTFIQAIRFIKP